MLLRELEPPGGIEPAHEHGLALLHRVQPDDGHEQSVRVGERQRQQPAHDARDVARVVSGFAGEPKVLV